MPKRKKFHGIVPAFITPFDRRGNVDVEGAKRLVRYQLKNGVHGIFALSSTGELASLTPEQREALTKAVVAEVRGRATVYVGASATCMKETLANVQQAAEWGGDAAVVIPPYFLNYSQAELVEYYRTVARESPIPVLAYNIPGRAKVSLDVPTLQRMHEEGSIVGLKDTTVDMARMMALCYAFRDECSFSTFQGSELLVGPSFLFGCDGAVAALANVAPKQFVQVYNAALKKDVDKVYRLQREINGIFQLFFGCGDIGATVNNFLLSVKVALKLLGLCDTPMAQLSREPKKEEVKKVRAILVKHGLLG